MHGGWIAVPCSNFGGCAHQRSAGGKWGKLEGTFEITFIVSFCGLIRLLYKSFECRQPSFRRVTYFLYSGICLAYRNGEGSLIHSFLRERGLMEQEGEKKNCKKRGQPFRESR